MSFAIYHHQVVWIWKFIVLIHVMTYHSTWQWKGFIQEKKQFKFSAGLTDVTTRPSKMKVSPKIIKSWSSFWGWWRVRRTAKRKKIVHSWLRWRNPFLDVCWVGLHVHDKLLLGSRLSKAKGDSWSLLVLKDEEYLHVFWKYIFPKECYDIV